MREIKAKFCLFVIFVSISVFYYFSNIEARLVRSELALANFQAMHNVYAIAMAKSNGLGGLVLAEVYKLLKEELGTKLEKIFLDRDAIQQIEGILKREGYLEGDEYLDYERYKEMYEELSLQVTDRESLSQRLYEIVNKKGALDAFFTFLGKIGSLDKPFFVSKRFDFKEYQIAIVVDPEFNQKLYANRRLWTTIYTDGTSEDIRTIREKKLKTLDQFIKEYEENHPDKEVIAAIPNGNVLWNDWFVSWVEGKVYSRWEEPIGDREYSMLVVRKNGSISIEDLSFQQEGENYRVIEIETGQDITDEVLYTTFGQQIIEDFEPVDIVEKRNFVHWDDLRHLLSFPRVKWHIKEDKPGEGIFNILELGEEVRGKENLSGSLYVGIRSLLGEDVTPATAERLAGERNVLGQALKGEAVEIDYINELKTIFKERLGDILTEQKIESIMGKIDTNKADLIKLLEEGIEKQGYVEDADGIIDTGEYRLDKITGKFEINFIPGIYPNSIIGLTENREIVITTIEGLSGRMGTTLEQAMELMKKQGVKNAIMIANGGDVVFRYKDKILLNSSENRNNFTSAILVVSQR